MFLGNALNFQMSANLFNHLVRLPLEWFEKRHIGDIVSRFGATGPIQHLFLARADRARSSTASWRC